MDGYLTPSGDLFLGPSCRNQLSGFEWQVFRFDYGFNHELFRQLSNEFYDVFRKQRSLCEFVQNSDQCDRPSISSLELQKFSLHYQAIMRSVYNKMKKDDAVEAERLKNALVVWSLVDVLLLRSADSLPSSDLCEWSQANSDLLSCYHSCEDLDVWTKGRIRKPRQFISIQMKLCVGNLEESIALLENSVRLVDPVVSTIHDMLNRMRISDELDKATWFRSQESVKRLLDNDYFAAYKELEIIAKIVVGDSTIFDHLSAKNNLRWYEVIVGRVLFCNKFCKVYELADLIPNNIKQAQSEHHQNRFDEILVSVFELDVIQMLKSLCLYFPNWLFVTHLADLLHYAGCTELSIAKSDIDFREYLIFEYANSLMSHSSLWHLSFEYLSYCPTYGKMAIKLYVERLAGQSQLCSDYKILKLLETCRKYEFTDTVASICKERCIAALKSGDVNKALSWCLQTENSSLAGYVSEQLLNFQCKSDQQAGKDCLNALCFLSSCLKSSNLMTNSSLVFLSKYSDFVALRNNEDLEKAAHLLCELIVCKLSPRRFWSVMLEDLLLLLESSGEKNLLSADEIYELMLVVENMSIETEMLNNADAFRSSNRSRVHFDNLLNDIRIYLLKELSSVAV